MTEGLQKALETCEMTYSQLVEIANGITKDYTKKVDDLILYASNNIENMTTDFIRNFMIKLALESYSFSEIKEKASIKAECAEMLKKEAYAKEFNGIDEGSVAYKENVATLNISNEIVTECIYNLVASLLKTKLDECHKVVDCMKSVLMSRMSEAKLSGIGGIEE